MWFVFLFLMWSSTSPGIRHVPNENLVEAHVYGKKQAKRNNYFFNLQNYWKKLLRLNCSRPEFQVVLQNWCQAVFKLYLHSPQKKKSCHLFFETQSLSAIQKENSNWQSFHTVRQRGRGSLKRTNDDKFTYMEFQKALHSRSTENIIGWHHFNRWRKAHTHSHRCRLAQYP